MSIVPVTTVTLNSSTDQTVEVDGKFSFTATIQPDNATYRKVKWSIDDITSYRFTKSGSGALVLPEYSYSFGYKFEEDTLEIDFEKQNLRDSTFKVSVVDGVMNLQCLDGYFENEYELHKVED